MSNELNRDQIALDAATTILPMYFESIPGVQLKAKIQCAVRDAINLAAPAQGALTDAEIDTRLDAVLRASGTALKHFSMPSTLCAMRTAMRAAIQAQAGDAPADTKGEK